MKRSIPFVLLLAGLSAFSGYLLSKASWIGKVGMTFFYREYNLLKVWWQGGAAVFIFMLIFFLLQGAIHRRFPFYLSKMVQLLFLLAAAAGLYFTIDDFTHDFSHHILGRRFHYGFYLAWAEWMLISLFFLFAGRPVKKQSTAAGKMETAAV